MVYIEYRIWHHLDFEDVGVLMFKWYIWTIYVGVAKRALNFFLVKKLLCRNQCVGIPAGSEL